MYDLDALEAINVEQLVTATDRLLFASRLPRRRRAIARGTTELAVAARLAVAHSDERTAFVRQDPSAPAYVTLLGATAAIAWLAVLLICLLV
jgi:hypothetical protein